MMDVLDARFLDNIMFEIIPLEDPTSNPQQKDVHEARNTQVAADHGFNWRVTK